MSDKTSEPRAVRTLAGLASAGVLTAGCAVVWQESAWIAERIGLPELRILLAMSVAFIVLSLAQWVGSRLPRGARALPRTKQPG